MMGAGRLVLGSNAPASGSRHGRVLDCKSQEEIAEFSPSMAAQFAQEHADLHLVTIDDYEGPKAHCSLWWSRVPGAGRERLGVIGHYRAVDRPASDLLLHAACDLLRSAGCTRAIAPMNGNTWREYRFVIEPGNEPPFFLEPQNPPEWPQNFIFAGFAPLANYYSVLNTDLFRENGRVRRAATRMRSGGITIRQACAGDLQSEFVRMYRMCTQAFKGSLLYTDLPEAEFLAHYRKVLPVTIPELILLAERGPEVVGFLFAVPDILQQRAQLGARTFIIKTVAVLPHRELRGLGSVLVEHALTIGREMGFRRCIGALMHETNASLNLARRYGQPMRRYSLFAKDLRR